jgi:opacity protein-like surface antigen
MMSHKNLLVGALMSTLCFTPILEAAYWSPHVGFDYKWWGLEPNSGRQSPIAISPSYPYTDIFPRINHSLNFYAGTRINGFFGVDFGYEQSERAQKYDSFQGVEFYFATPEVKGNATDINMRLRDIHLDINFYWEVARNFEILFMAGLAMLHIDTHIYHYANATNTWVEFNNSSENKAMGRIGIGAQYNILPQLGIKFLINGEPGIRINNEGYDQTNTQYSIYPYKTAVSYNIGLVYSFSSPRRHQEMRIVDKYHDGD